MTRLAILASHPVQYYAPLFCALAQHVDLTVFYAHAATAHDQARAGFGIGFAWDVDLLSGYDHVFLSNVSRNPGLGHFSGVDTPDIGHFLQDGRFDVLLLMGWHIKSFIQGLVAAKRNGMPVMVRGDSHLDTPRSLLKVAAKRVLYPLFLRQFDAALIVGKRNRAYWEHYRYPEERMFHTPHCVDNTFFADRATHKAGIQLREQLGIGSDAKVVLFAGKLVAFKRPLDVLHAVAKVREQGVDAHLLIAGAGELERELRDQAKILGAPLHELGFCNQTKMPAVYAASDILALPSDGRETWGLVVNEALACGKPVLASDAVGCAPDIAELLGPEAVFPLGDIGHFAHKLGQALMSPSPPERIAAASSHFDLNTSAERIAAAAKALTPKKAIWAGS